jgi:hypothetical protein
MGWPSTVNFSKERRDACANNNTADTPSPTTMQGITIRFMSISETHLNGLTIAGPTSRLLTSLGRGQRLECNQGEVK